MSKELEARVRSWVADDIDPDDQQELNNLLDALREDPGSATLRELESRFSGPLRFGTAGLRGRAEAGQHRMNRATVVRATAGLAHALLAAVPDASERGVVVGRDARRDSRAFQDDIAAVLLARGIKVFWLPDVVPTPVLAFSVRRLGAAAGVMVTASHNPPADNGYKVYWAHGAQIAPPLDEEIARAIDLQPGAREVPRRSRAEARDLVVSRPDLVDAYLQALDSLRFVPEAPVKELSIVYTALHGVGGAVFLEAARRRGLGPVHVVEEQQSPDPTFPTVAFPNPEEDGALDLALARAEAVGADLVVANDPDADRLAAVVRHPGRGYVNLSGNEIGVLLARHLIDHDQPEDTSRVVVNTLVSSRLLGRMANDLGVRYEETLTGFKHIAERMRDLEEEGYRGLMGYEEALGYAVSREVHDKDGVSAALVLVEMAAVAKAEGRTLIDVLEAIHRAHGLFAGRTRSVRLSDVAAVEAAMVRLRQAPDEDLQALGVRSTWDLGSGERKEITGGDVRLDNSLSANLLVFDLEQGGRVAIRPSGTEPKLKVYLEAEVSWPHDESHLEVEERAQATLQAIEGRIVVLAGLGS